MNVAIANTHKSVIMQMKIRTLLLDTKDENVFFERLAGIINLHTKVAVRSVRLVHTAPHELPQDILFIRNAPGKNTHTFSNKRHTRIPADTSIRPPGQGQMAHQAEQAAQLVRFHVADTNLRYIIWPPTAHLFSHPI
jgi:hypothetical protein